MKKIFILLLLFLFCLSFTVKADDYMPSIEFTCPITEASIGDTFNVTITLHSQREFIGFKFNTITFLPAGILHVKKLTLGPFWKGYTDSFILYPPNIGTIDNSSGQIRNSQCSILPDSPDDTNLTPPDVILLNITFLAVDSGTVTITSSDSRLYYADATTGDHTINSIQITIPSSDNGGDNGGNNNPPPPPPPPPPPSDSDGDGISDENDICPGHDDNIDTDNDGIPDGCDDTPEGDNDPPDDPPDTNDTEPDPPTPEPLKAIIKFDNKVYKVGDFIKFSGKESTGDIIIWYWEFGDGVSTDSKLLKGEAHHNYQSPGNYTVRLTIEDTEGKFSMTTVNVTVKPLPSQESSKDVEKNSIIEESPFLGIIFVIAVIVFFLTFVYLRRKGKL